MSEQEIILPPQQPRRQDARDLQSRLYRDIGLAAVEAALLLAEPEEVARPETRAERPLGDEVPEPERRLNCRVFASGVGKRARDAYQVFACQAGGAGRGAEPE